MESKRGEGQLQWNVGGWFGGQVGGTCWLLALAVVVLAKGGVAVGLALLISFAAPNVVGLWLWRRRDRLAPFVAMQRLLAVMTVFSLAALATLHLSGAQGLAQPGESFSPWLYGLALIYPAVMFQLWMIDRSSRKGKDGS